MWYLAFKRTQLTELLVIENATIKYGERSPAINHILDMQLNAIRKVQSQQAIANAQHTHTHIRYIPPAPSPHHLTVDFSRQNSTRDCRLDSLTFFSGFCLVFSLALMLALKRAARNNEIFMAHWREKAILSSFASAIVDS